MKKKTLLIISVICIALTVFELCYSVFNFFTWLDFQIRQFQGLEFIKEEYRASVLREYIFSYILYFIRLLAVSAGAFSATLLLVYTLKSNDFKQKMQEICEKRQEKRQNKRAENQRKKREQKITELEAQLAKIKNEKDG